MATEAIPRKTWRQALKPAFGLRALMIFVLLVGGGLGWLVHRARVQREAVAAIKAAGGKVYYDWEWQDGQPVASSSSPVPKWLFDLVGPDHVGSVAAVFLNFYFAGGKVDDALMARLARLDHLERLNLTGNPKVTDDSLIHLRNLTKLRHLDLGLTGVRGPGLRHLKPLRELRELDLSEIPLNGADLAQLKDFTLLTSLILSSAHINDQDMESIGHLNHLTTLVIRCPEITNAGLSHFKGLDHLETLLLDSSKVDSLQSLEGLKGIKKLGLGSKVDEAVLGSLSAFPGLESLMITGATVTDAGFEAIGRLTTLKHLGLYGRVFNDADLEHLSGLTELMHLQLVQTGVSDAGLPRLYELQKLRYLDVRLSDVTPAGIAALEAKLPALKVTGLTPGAVVQKRPKRLSLVDSIIFQPRKYVEAEWPRLDKTIEDVWFKSADGVRLNGWYAATPKPRAVVLYMHGNAGNIGHRRYVIDLFRDRLQCSVMIFDYRGYGRSEGTPSESGVLADARAARKWLADASGMAEKDIVLAGQSLGGGVAVDLAAKDGARGLILESTFTSLPDVAAKSFKILPVRLIVRTKLDSLSKIPDYKGPLLQSHGDADKVIPFVLGERLFNAANKPKRFVRNPGGGHNDLPSREYLEALDQFLNELPALGKPR